MLGLGFGYSQGVVFFMYAAVMRLGIELVVNGTMTFDDVYR